jgi:hypothetical protein
VQRHWLRCIRIIGVWPRANKGGEIEKTGFAIAFRGLARRYDAIVADGTQKLGSETATTVPDEPSPSPANGQYF